LGPVGPAGGDVCGGCLCTGWLARLEVDFLKYILILF
jgi:hypothetical protein